MTAPVVHTAGPWKIDRRRSWDEIRDAKGIVLAQVTSLGRDANTAQANARLITAAPDLLEALSSVRWVSADKDNMEFEARITYSQMNTIRAAIAKAQQP